MKRTSTSNTGMSRFHGLLALGGLLALAAPFSVQATDLVGGAAPVLLPPEEAIKTFTLDPDYQINLYASEVDFPLTSPAAMTFDAHGRLWVANIPSQPHAKPGVPTKDSIVILEDTDKNGVADKSTVFHDDLYLPMGFGLTNNGREVYAVSEPNLMRLSDEDGDGVADKKEFLMHGWGTEDNHHVISAFQWSPDGRMHFGQGLFLNTQVETPYGPVRAHEAATFRFDPRDQRLSVYASYGWSNVWGMVFDRWGSPMLADASPGLNYWMDHTTANFTYPKPNKYTQYEQEGGSISFTPPGRRPSCGNELLDSAHFPEEVRGWYLTTQMKGWHGIRWYQLDEDGSGVKATQPKATDASENEMLSCSDIIFRPVALQIGPDGALYMLDYYNPIVGHTTYNFRDPRHIKTYGRVWRITHKTRPLDWQPEIVGRPVAELLELLTATNSRTVYHARREIQERPQDEILAATDAWFAAKKVGDDGYEKDRVEALWMHQSANDYDFDLLKAVLSSHSADARNAGLRTLRYWQEHMSGEDSLALYAAAVADENQRCRLNAVTGLSYHRSPADALKVAAKVLDREMDHGMIHATREVFLHLTNVTGSSLPAVEKFLLPFREDSELLEFELTETVAGEILGRKATPGGITADSHRKALAVLAGGADAALPEALRRISQPTSSSDPQLQVLSPTVVAWPAAEVKAHEDLFRKTINEGKNPSAKVIAEAALYRAGVIADAAQTSAAPSTVAYAAALAGRGKVPESLFPLVAGLMDAKNPVSLHTIAIKALPLFPAHDAEALKLLAETSDRYAEQGNLTVSFAALEAMQRIPKSAWPAEYDNRVVNVIRINATADLRFDPAEVSVKAGSAVRLTFFNPDSMYHNLAIIQKGSLDEIGLKADMMAGDPDGLKKNYIPDDPRVLHATPQITLGPGLARSHTMVFYAPEEPGDYPYICTFPGHWRAMKGVLHVVE